MEILYLGHSSFHIKGKNASVVTDPFDSTMVGMRFPKVAATIVTVSHEHADHNKTELVGDAKKVIRGPGEYEIEGVSVIGIPSYHDSEKGRVRGRNTIYVIEIDGLRVAHLGDLGHKLGDDVVEAIGDVDVLMVPVGGVYTIGPQEAAEVARAIEPNIIIPMHYQVSGLNAEAFSELKDEKLFIGELGLTTRPEKKLSLKAGEDEETTDVVVLEIV